MEQKIRKNTIFILFCKNRIHFLNALNSKEYSMEDKITFNKNDPVLLILANKLDVDIEDILEVYEKAKEWFKVD